MALLLARSGMALSTRLSNRSSMFVRCQATTADTKKGATAKEPTVGKGVLVENLMAAELSAKISRKDMGEIVDSLLDDIMLSVAEGKTVTIPGFGSFKPRTRAARKGRNPSTGEVIDIPESVGPAFSAGSTFKGVVKAGSWEAFESAKAK
jgi:DNA-binding protein HU-beta